MDARLPRRRRFCFPPGALTAAAGAAEAASPPPAPAAAASSAAGGKMTSSPSSSGTVASPASAPTVEASPSFESTSASCSPAAAPPASAAMMANSSVAALLANCAVASPAGASCRGLLPRPPRLGRWPPRMCRTVLASTSEVSMRGVHPGGRPRRAPTELSNVPMNRSVALLRSGAPPPPGRDRHQSVLVAAVQLWLQQPKSALPRHEKPQCCQTCIDMVYLAPRHDRRM